MSISRSLIYLGRNTYSVTSRLIGEQVDVHLGIDRVKAWDGQRKVAEMPDAALTAQGSRGLLPHHRLAGAQTWSVREPPLLR